MIAPTPQDDQQARDALAYIRSTMATASSFTAISGWGLVVVGIVGLITAGTLMVVATNRGTEIWIGTAAVCILASGVATARKANASETPLWSGTLQKLAWIMTPSLAAGALITVALMRPPFESMLHGTWLALYGAAITAGGTYSVREFRWMGILFIGLGAIALFRPELSGWMMGLGFGGLHLGFGVRIARKYGG